MLLLTLPALAVDAHPNLLAPAAVPLEPFHGQIDLRAATGITMQDVRGWGHLARATLSFGRVSVGGLAGHQLLRGNEYRPDAMVELMADPLAFERFRLRLVVGAGTVLRAGAALWFATPSRWIEIDLGFGATFVTSAAIPPRRPKLWADVDRQPRLEWHGLASQAELGFTVFLDRDHRSHVRLGNFAYLPNLTLRLSPRLSWIDFGLEVTGGYMFDAGGVFSFAFTGGRAQRRAVTATTRNDAPIITGE